VRFNQKVNYYQILELQENSSIEEIHLAFEKCKQTFSLSNIDLYSVFSPSEARAWLSLIEESYQVLSNSRTRLEYDRFRSNLPKNIAAPDLTADISERNEFDSLDNSPKVGTTSVSRYQLSEEIENEITNRVDFDGVFLKKIRVYKNVSIAEFSQKTCIGSRHINAIENNNFSALPAAVFVRGYIVQYCRVLNLEEQKVVTSFMSHYSNEQRSLT